MASTAAGLRRSSWVVNFSAQVGLFFFFVCLVPIFIDQGIAIQDGRDLKYIPHIHSLIAAVAASFPSICDSLMSDISFSQRLTSPRSLVITSIFMPNALSLLMKLCGAGGDKSNIALFLASSTLFMCGLISYIAGEVANRKLLYFLGFCSVALSLTTSFLVYRVMFISVAAISGTWFGTLEILFRILFTLLLIWFAHDMQTLDTRRKAYAKLYAFMFLVYLLAPVLSGVVLRAYDVNSMYNADVSIVYKILVGLCIAVVPSRMAQYDEVMMMVRAIFIVGRRVYSCLLFCPEYA
jgi:hypothetical protein